MNPSRHRRLGVTAIAGLVLLTGCGAQVREDPAAAPSTVVERCAEPVPYPRPARTVTYEAGSTDKLLVLGLADAIRGYVMPPANPPVTESPYADQYARLELLSTDLLNRELVVDAGADMVVAGWRSGFSDERGITPELLDGLGIQSFMHTETCFNYPGFPEQVPPLEALYSDLDRLGRIYGVPDRARDVIASYRARVAAVEQAVPADRARPGVFVYDSGTDRPRSAGSQVPPTDLLRIAGAENIFGDTPSRWNEVTWEAVVDRQPQAIVIVDYGDRSAEEKIQFLRSLPQLQGVPAIRDDRFFVLDYNEAISGPRNIDGAEKLGAWVRSLPPTS
ncbi:ABC transporter substrate-binding protein [Actinomycetospora sp. NBC_00405]|uniref:ABC transporter substrate-binding protein n=1 Tax=Actinomycetospora sp. NBC_00405 TaxID=2975952 RepID=UPI002E20C954